MTEPLIHMVVDTANILFRVHATNSRMTFANPADQAGLALHQALQSLRAQFNKFKPDQVAISFEGGRNWRKAHTRGARPEPVVSGRMYKGNRVKDDSMIPFFELITSFEQLAREHTSLICLSDPELEGDDCISAYVQKYSALGHTVIVVSDDKDFCTLLQLPNVRLIRPDGTERKLGVEKMPADAKYFMYEKAFRGDVGDNVIPAFPRVRSTRLQKAWAGLQKGDTFEHSNLMNETWDFTDPATGLTQTFRVGDLYEENILLMDLINGQPQDIKTKMSQMVDAAVQNHGQFSLFHFQKFCGKYNLKKIGDEAMKFVPVFSVTGQRNPERTQEVIQHDFKKPAKRTFVF